MNSSFKQIPLNGKHGLGKFAIVDNEDFELCNKYKWRGHSAGYAHAYCKIKGSYIYMHRLVTNAEKGLEVDHIDHNKLNNTKANLRVCLRADNLKNTIRWSSNKFNMKGVRKLPSGLYAASSTVNHQSYHIGIYYTPKEAGLAYDRFIEKHYGEYANLNFPDEKTIPQKAKRTPPSVKSNTGERHISYIPSRSKFQVTVRRGDKVFMLGRFKNIEEAKIKRDQYLMDCK